MDWWSLGAKLSIPPERKIPKNPKSDAPLVQAHLVHHAIDISMQSLDLASSPGPSQFLCVEKIREPGDEATLDQSPSG